MHRRTGLLLILIALPLVVMLSTATNASAQVCAFLTLTTQAEVNAVNCSSVTGILTISGPDITDLSPLSSVTSVGGDLFIQDNPVLTNLVGLGGITSVGEDLFIAGNPVLTNLDGLAGITSVGGAFLQIHDNAVLTNLDGLSGITSVGGNLQINRNGVLTNLDGFSPQSARASSATTC